MQNTIATSKTISHRKPADVTIKPQRMGFEFGEQVPRYWLENSPFLSHMMNALSILFPEGERFFVDSVRMFRDQVTDPALKEEIKGFIGQEAMHSLEHITMNQHVRDQGMPVEELEDQLKVLLGIARKLPKRQQLAITCALEHITAMMADMLLDRNDVREDMHESMRPLWVWHAIEETEHKGVAYDVYQSVGGNYLERTGALVASTGLLFVVAGYFTTRMMVRDRKSFSLKDTAKGLWRCWGRDGAFSSLIPIWLDYFKPGYHPWQHDNSALIKRFKDEIEGYIAPEFKAGNRRTLN
ncbi:MAG: metal-dependent hydrolase [Marinobacter sp.]|nr:metal-dependent hydrolase [Marinobacter sp.]